MSIKKLIENLEDLSILGIDRVEPRSTFFG